MKNKEKKDFNPIAIYLVLSLVVPAWLGIVYGIFSMGNIDGLTKFTYIATLLAETAIFIIFIVKYSEKIMKDFKEITLKKLLYIVLIAIALIGLNEGLTYLFSKFEVATENQDMIIEMFNTFKIPTIISVAIFAPLIEEFVFRYSIETLIKNDKVFLLVSSIAFGVLHGIGIITILYVLIGLLLGIIYLKFKKNIAAPIIIHFLNNTFSVIMLLLGI